MKQVLRVGGEKFVRRFLLHVLPTGFKRIRHYGLLAPAHKAQRLAAARAALQVPPPDPVVVEAVADFLHRVATFDLAACPRCRIGRMVVIAALPPWRSIGQAPRGPP